MATACFRSFTFGPDLLPLCSLPLLNSDITFLTFACFLVAMAGASCAGGESTRDLRDGLWTELVEGGDLLLGDAPPKGFRANTAITLIDEMFPWKAGGGRASPRHRFDLCLGHGW